MKKSKRINRNLSFIGIIILGVLVYVFGTSVYDGLNTVSPWKDKPQKVSSVIECDWSVADSNSSFIALNLADFCTSWPFYFLWKNQNE